MSDGEIKTVVMVLTPKRYHILRTLLVACAERTTDAEVLRTCRSVLRMMGTKP